MDTINAHELHEIKQNKTDFILLDVREDEELKIAKIDPHQHIPMGEIHQRLDELDKKKLIVVMCHGGFRSAKVCSYLNKEGYRAINFTGGIRSWSQEVDPTVPQY